MDAISIIRLFDFTPLPLCVFPSICPTCTSELYSHVLIFDLQHINQVDGRSHRVGLWQQLFSQKQANPSTSINLRRPTRLTLNGKEVSGGGSISDLNVTDSSSAGDLGRQYLGESVLRTIIVAKVDGQLWDLYRPLPADAQWIDFLNWEDSEARNVFWHSSAHILGLVLEQEFNASLTNGPPLPDGGFYYDVSLPGGATLTPEDVERIQKRVDQVLQERHRFERLELSKEDALVLFQHNPFKLEFIRSKVPDGGIASIYKCSDLIDLCRGPHIPHTGLVKALAVTKTSSSYWLGDAKNASLQRVFGISFTEKKMLKEWQTLQAEAAKRDHRVIGKQQELFMFHSYSPGSAFFLPRGTKVYNKLVDYIRREYRKRGYVEVITPNIFNKDLWVTSGHWENYKDNMFVVDLEEPHDHDHEHDHGDPVQFGLKPMNCPGHCLIFDSSMRSYRELPVRLADFGVLHRNELSGALTGLTRVRRFQQDDAHIFCTQAQIRSEIHNALDFMKSVYGTFGFTEFHVNLSTRPEANYLGELSQWEEAEAALKEALTSVFGNSWALNPGDGAFYGPKIDVKVTDALRRQHQCATIQLDFQLPIRFNLKYRDETDRDQRPVIVHRAILGSVERFLGMLEPKISLACLSLSPDNFAQPF
jgi:threonyl-tRNA synthetase